MECSILKEAKETIVTQASQILQLGAKLEESFSAVVQAILKTRGRVALCGIGKSGLIAQKISSTLASTGTPSYFIHAAEALHGDMGMLHSDDLIICISNSGQTQEVLEIIHYAKKNKIFVVGLTGSMNSKLATLSDIALNINVNKEICPNNLAPTSSTLATLCLGDVLAVSVMKERNFTANDFARLHPGGSLGRKLLYTVGDVMIKEDLPIVKEDETISKAVMVMTSSRLGLCLVYNDQEKLIGIISDGDLRRGLNTYSNLLEHPLAAIMSENPLCVPPELSLTEADLLLGKHQVKALVVFDDKQEKALGIYDLFLSQ